VQGGKLDGDARRRAKASFRLLGNAVEGGGIGIGVAGGIGMGARCFAKHVEAVGEALAPLRRRSLHGLVNRPAENELLAQDLHRLANGGANHRLAEPADGAT
jgi:hypothetical protein